MTHDVIDPPAREAAHSDSVEALLQFSERTAEKPYVYAGLPPEGVPATRGTYRSRAVRVTNARPFAHRLSLDVEGLAVVRRPSAVGDPFDEAQTLAVGHPETAALVRDVTGASRVVVFDHTRRRATAAEPKDRSSPEELRPPATRVHVDQTVESGPKRVREIMGAQAEALLAGRAAIINVWRPIGYPARDRPLAVGDARSFDPDDLIDRERPDLPASARRDLRHRVQPRPALALPPGCGAGRGDPHQVLGFARLGGVVRAARRLRGSDRAARYAAAPEHRVPDHRFLRLRLH